MIKISGDILLNFNAHDVLYHGTIDIYANIIREYGIKIVNRTKNGVDFGPGFYMCSGNRWQAVKWVQRKADNIDIPNKVILDLLNLTIEEFLSIRKNAKPVVMNFKIKDISTWETLNYKIFKTNSIEWQRYVWEWRQAQAPPKDIGWVFGPVADGGIYDSSPNNIRAFDKQNQLSIHNEVTAQLLELLEVEEC